MTPPPKADTTPYAAPVEGSSESPHSNGYAPSVPLSVYRELSTELQTTKAMVDALHRQNKQLSRHNQALRHEIQRFVQSAEQLGHFAGISEEEGNSSESIDLDSEAKYPEAMPSALVSIPKPRPQTKAIQSRERPETSPKRQPRLFTEQPELPRRPNKGNSRPQDLSNLWLVTTILLVIFTAFGAGFLIMRPLLNR